jgi:hypothetical protein
MLNPGQEQTQLHSQSPAGRQGCDATSGEATPQIPITPWRRATSVHSRASAPGPLSRFRARFSPSRAFHTCAWCLSASHSTSSWMNTSSTHSQDTNDADNLFPCPLVPITITASRHRRVSFSHAQLRPDVDDVGPGSLYIDFDSAVNCKWSHLT